MTLICLSSKLQPQISSQKTMQGCYQVLTKFAVNSARGSQAKRALLIAFRVVKQTFNYWSLLWSSKSSWKLIIFGRIFHILLFALLFIIRHFSERSIHFHFLARKKFNFSSFCGFGPNERSQYLIRQLHFYFSVINHLYFVLNLALLH